MTKQEEIREGIAKDIYTDWAIGSVSWEKTMEAEKLPWLRTADKVMKGENSQGVVIKVDDKLPNAFDIDDDVLSAVEYKEKLKDYVKVVPLVEE